MALFIMHRAFYLPAQEDLEARGCLAERVLKRGMMDRNLGLYTLELYVHSSSSMLTWLGLLHSEHSTVLSPLSGQSTSFMAPWP